MSDEILVLKDGMIYDQFNTINNDYSGLKPYTTELTTQPFWNNFVFKWLQLDHHERFVTKSSYLINKPINFKKITQIYKRKE